MMESRVQLPQYRPFPNFGEWSRVEVSLQDAIQSADRFAQVKKGIPSSVLDGALERTTRAAAVDTNAIEGIFPTDRGFTETVAHQLDTWETQMEEKGQHARPAFEDTLRGFEFVLTSVKSQVPLTQHWVRQLHEILLNSQETFLVRTAVGFQEQKLPKGQYKTQPNSPTRPDGTLHFYAPVEDTPAEMERFISEINSDAFKKSDAIVQATYAHYAFVCIHPFADGNGRVARTLASAFLYEGYEVPLLIFQDQRADYIHALETADAGEPLRLTRFIAERVTDTINTVILDLSRPVNQKTVVNQLADALRPTRALPELNGAALRLQEILYTEIGARLADHGRELDLDLVLRRSLNGRPPVPPVGYTAFADKYGLYLWFSSDVPKQTQEILPIILAARNGAEATSDLVAIASTGYRIDVFGRELEPAITESLRGRVRVFADGIVDIFLRQLIEAFKRS